MEDFQSHPFSQKLPRPYSVYNRYREEAEDKTASKDDAMIRPRVSSVQICDLADDRPRKQV